MIFFLLLLAMLSLGGTSANTGMRPADTQDLAEPAWSAELFDNDPVAYDRSLAYVSGKLSEAVEGDNGENRIKSMYTDGATPIRDWETYRFQEDGGAYAIGHSEMQIDGKDTVIVVVVSRGTQTVQEMIGDWLKGNPFEKTKIVLGVNVWKNVYDFYEGKEKNDGVLEGLNNYINTHSDIIDNGDEVKILITGHSLGGAAADLLAARLLRTASSTPYWWEDLYDREDIYAYTFGAIKVLEQEQNLQDGYENIHNIYNVYDSFGPNGSLAGLNVSSPNSKFGHTDLFARNVKGLGLDNHLMNTYLDAIRSGSTRWKFDCAQTMQSQAQPDQIPSQSEPQQQQEDDSFSIVGSWTSTGSEGFGQAQPGSEVWFDGTHCSFYSPYDTYEFYQHDGQWILDCTSAIFAETLSFDVDITDEDHITITWGNIVTELTRE